MTTLTWELHAPGSGVAFLAAAIESGYGITLSRDGVMLICERVSDGSALLQRSLELRRSFQRLGYSGFVHEEAPALRGGPCWGPGPLVPVSALVTCQGGRAAAMHPYPVAA